MVTGTPTEPSPGVGWLNYAAEVINQGRAGGRVTVWLLQAEQQPDAGGFSEDKREAAALAPIATLVLHVGG